LVVPFDFFNDWLVGWLVGWSVGRLGGWLVGLVVEGLGNPVFLSLLLLVGCLFVFVSFVVCFLV